MKHKEEWLGPGMTLLIVFSLQWVGCQGTEAAANKPANRFEESAGWLWPPSKQEQVTLAPGHKVYIRLDQEWSVHEDEGRGEFMGTLGRPLATGECVIAQVGTRVAGRFVHLDSGTPKDRAETKLAVETIVIGEEGYSLRTRPLSFSGHGIEIPISLHHVDSAHSGADDHVTGEGLSDAFLTGKREEAEFRPKTMFAFTLAEATELPASRAGAR